MQIYIEVNSFHSFKLNANIREALSCINQHPHFFDLENNYIRIYYFDYELVEFHRVFVNYWSMTLRSRTFSDTYKYLTTNTVKVIVINLYFGNSCSMLFNILSKPNWKEGGIKYGLQQIANYIKNKLKCNYCHHGIRGVEQELCEYCGIQLDITRFLYEFIFL